MTESSWTAFQLHRHDLQNYMQLVKAYLQLGKPEKALDAANQCAGWLTSLSRLQSQLSEDAGGARLLWTAATCSHLRVSLLNFSPVLDVSPLCEGIAWLEQQAAVHNSKYINAKLTHLPSNRTEEPLSNPAHPLSDDAETADHAKWQILIDGPDLDEWWSPSLAANVLQGVVVTAEIKTKMIHQGHTNG
ncbi:Spo0B domain-containing protein [Alicyclobacillus ferrooxydans]|uniref:SpoOB alpha-helical domain-containing protein n=1 Tax=Alicyclobacillus ferrooxydans TaxID=471514 RepID=A0A0N8PP37_9BACL|nr:Spo0B domain-containing protein [Alicyclobacillus ferrooxydans]KPV43237.1 hypothetical protein AN477_13365 [Alicyclobacillus ferrooxydans]